MIATWILISFDGTGASYNVIRRRFLPIRSKKVFLQFNNRTVQILCTNNNSAGSSTTALWVALNINVLVTSSEAGEATPYFQVEYGPGQQQLQLEIRSLEDIKRLAFCKSGRLFSDSRLLLRLICSNPGVSAASRESSGTLSFEFEVGSSNFGVHREVSIDYKCVDCDHTIIYTN